MRAVAAPPDLTSPVMSSRANSWSLQFRLSRLPVPPACPACLSRLSRQFRLSRLSRLFASYRALVVPSMPSPRCVPGSASFSQRAVLSYPYRYQYLYSRLQCILY